jgi:hypothetical protein
VTGTPVGVGDRSDLPTGDLVSAVENSPSPNATRPLRSTPPFPDYGLGSSQATKGGARMREVLEKKEIDQADLFADVL